MNTHGRQLRIPMRRALLVTTGFAALLACGGAAFGQASFVGLGVLPGMTNSFAYAVSDDGLVVVGTSDDASGANSRAFRWTAATGMVSLGVLPGATNSDAAGVSADGSVVVGTSGNAFRWTAGGGMVSLGTMHGATFSTASGVSADGSVVVGHNHLPETDLGFRWTIAGGMVSLGTLPGQPTSFAMGVNGDGSVIVGYTGPGYGPALRWSTQGLTGLGTFPGGSYSYGTNVSRGGSVVVGWSAMSTGPGHAFRWTPAGGLQDIGGTPGGGYTYALGVSGNGTVVGSGFFPVEGYTPFLWNAQLGMVAIPDYLSGLGIDLTGWSNTSLSFSIGAISPDGRVLVGTGTRNGHKEAWLATIPTCGSADFDNDGDTGTDADIESFMACVAGNCCATCGPADFNGDGDTGTDADIEAFFRVLAGGNC